MTSHAIHMSRWRIMALVLALAQVLTSLWLMPIEDRWFLHPDDHEAYVLSERIGNGEAPFIPLEENTASPWPLFAPPDALLMDGRIVSHRAPGLFYLLAPAAAISPDAAFLTLTLFGGAASVALYILAERLYGAKPALVATSVFAFAAPTLFWTAFLFANIPALTFLLGGLALSTSRRLGAWIGAVLFFTISVLLRYENALIVLPVAVAGLITQRKWVFASRRRALALFGTAGLAAAAVLAISWLLYGTFNFAAINAVPAQDTTGMKPTDVASSYASTVGAVKWENITTNVQTFLVPLALIPFAAIGFSPLVRRNFAWVTWSFGAGVLALTWFFLGNYFHPQGFLLSHSYGRYLLPLVALGALCVAHLVASLPSRCGTTFGAALVVVSIVASLSLVSGPAGFESAASYTKNARAHAQASAALPIDAVVVGEHAAKMLLEKRVISPTNVPVDLRRDATLDAIENLTRAGVPVFIPRNYLRGYGDWIRDDPRFELQPSPEHLFLRISPQGTSGG